MKEKSDKLIGILHILILGKAITEKLGHSWFEMFLAEDVTDFKRTKVGGTHV